MKENKKILAIIPARGGSKGIPRKNIRVLGGRPLLAYAVETAMAGAKILSDKMGISVDIVVSSEDDFIEEYITLLYPEIHFIKRSEELARDDITLDPVILHATKVMENKKGISYDAIITMLPTMPLLSVDTFISAITKFKEVMENRNSLVLVKEHRHLFWGYNNNLEKYTLITERKNRQYLKPLYEETGGIVITSRDYLMKTGMRVCEDPYLFVSPPRESIDINTWEDFILASNLLGRKRIGFVVSGSFSKGMGHVYRSLTIAMHLIEHEIYFFIMESDREAVEIIKSNFFRIITFTDEWDLIEKVKHNRIDAIINDTRGMSINLVEKLRKMGLKLININEINPRVASQCDLVINPEFEFHGYADSSRTLYLAGYQYNIIRDDVLMFPVKPMPASINTIVITMGGSDPEEVSYKVLTYINEIPFLKNKDIYVVIGKFFDTEHVNKIENLTHKMNDEGYKVSLVMNTKFMGYYLYNADLLITSNSSTVYDAVALETLSIVISKVKEEITHLFSKLSGATAYLGYHEDANFHKFKNATQKLCEDIENRKYYYNTLVEYAKHIRDGQRIVYNTIRRVIGGDKYERSY